MGFLSNYKEVMEVALVLEKRWLIMCITFERVKLKFLKVN